MYLFALVCSILVFTAHASPFIGKLSNVGTAVRNIGANLFSKLSGGQVPPLPPAVAEGDLVKQLEFMNKMLKQVRGFIMSPSPLIREKMRPYTQTLIDQIIPQFEQLQFTNDELKNAYKLRPEDIVKFRGLLADTIDELKKMSSTMNKDPKPSC